MFSSFIRSGPRLHRLLTFLFCVCVLMVLLLVFTVRYHGARISNIKTVKFWSYLEKEQKCPDVLQKMTHGRWIPANVSTEHKLATRLFYRTARNRRGIPNNLQRQDGLCGTVTFPGHQDFRAICDADGPNPCCWQGRCTNRTIEECQCPGCFDGRNRLFAEDSIWTPYESSCSVSTMYETPSQVCSTLNNTSILFVGDSLIRNLYTTFLWMTSGDWKFGAMKPNTPKDIQRSCSGRDQRKDATCRASIDWTRTTCDSKTKLQFLEIYKVTPGSTKTIIDHLTAMPFVFKMLVIGIGLHEQLNFLRVTQQYLDPVLQNLNCTSGLGCPKLLWLAPHSPGLLKSPIHKGQQAEIVRFTSQMKQHLKQTNMAMFDPFNLTRYVHSYDGAHAAFSVVVVKAKIMLNYIEELKHT